MEGSIPFALFNSKALFNPYQYKPFFIIKKENVEDFEWNGKNLFITDEVGVGKTFEVGIILQELLRKKENFSVLIICPVKLCSNWESELSENFYLNFNNYWITKQLGQFNILPYSYFTPTKIKEDVSTAIEDEENAQNELDIIDTHKIDLLKYDILILDEAHYIRNKGALWQSIHRLVQNNESREKKLKIFMTATPIFNNKEDYENITELLKYHEQRFETTTTLQGEANCYDYILDIQVRNINLAPNEQAIIEEIEQAALGRQKGFIKRIASSSLYALKEFIDGKLYIEWENYEENIKIESLTRWTEQEDTKFKELTDLLSALRETETSTNPFKVIIFSTYLVTCSYLERRLKDYYKVYKITGKDNLKAVRNAKINFQKDTSPSILICSDAAKEGHNLQFCRYLIHYDFPYTPAALGQRNGRIYRKGMQEMPKVFYMHVNNSYDDRLFGEIIVEKSNTIEKISEQGMVSILNVLPQNASDYIEGCLDSYFLSRVIERAKRENRIEMNEGQDYTVEHERKEYEFQLKKLQLNDDNDSEPSEEKGYYRNRFKALYSEKNYIPEGIIIKHYQDKYSKTFEEIASRIFSNATTVEEFKGNCEYYVKSKTSHNVKYCHNLLEQEEGLLEYKQQFKPLIELI